MHAIVTVCTASGALRRYERIGDGTARLTHEALFDGWNPDCVFQRGLIEDFRANPAADFAITETPLLKPEHDAPWRCDPHDVA